MVLRSTVAAAAAAAAAAGGGGARGEVPGREAAGKQEDVPEAAETVAR